MTSWGLCFLFSKLEAPKTVVNTRFNCPMKYGTLQLSFVPTSRTFVIHNNFQSQHGMCFCEVLCRHVTYTNY